MAASEWFGRDSGKLFDRAFLVLLLIGTSVVVLFLTYKLLVDPQVPFLIPGGGAQWIRFPEPVNLIARKGELITVHFQKEFDVHQGADNLVLKLHAMKQASVWLDDMLVWKTRPEKWKAGSDIDLTGVLQPGTHRIRITVENRNGHPCLKAHSRELHLSTDETWVCAKEGEPWRPAVCVDNLQRPPISERFERADRALKDRLRFLGPLFAVVFIVAFMAPRCASVGLLGTSVFTVSRIRWIVLFLFLLLGINNIVKLPLYVGMDVKGHVDYILYVFSHSRIPLAHEGWEMFQPPLYYVLSAFVYAVVHSDFTFPFATRILRILPLVCGLAQIELCFRAIRQIYPEREDLQAVGTVFCGLIPMNLYMSPVVGNEPLAALLSSMVVYFGIQLCRPPSEPTFTPFLLMGVFLGLSLLTKASALFLVLPLSAGLLYAVGVRQEWCTRRLYRTVWGLVLTLGLAFALCGWYYIRNRLELGHFFVGNWDPGLFDWWQDPSYRTVRQMTTFGQSLFWPVYSSIHGFWDSVYATFWMDSGLSGIGRFEFRPPWNYDFMLSLAWVSLFPSALIVFGAATVLLNPASAVREGTLFPGLCVLTYLGVLFYFFLVVANYSAAKASYTLGVLPCYAILGVKPLKKCMEIPLLRAFCCAALGCWAVCVYCAFWVI